MAGPESIRGRELERVERSFLLAAGLVGVKGRGELRVFFFFFDVLPVGMRKGRELLEFSASLRECEKEIRWSLVFLSKCGPVA